MVLIAHLIFIVASLGLMIAAVAGRIRKPAGDYGRLVQGSGATFVGLVATGTALVISTGSPILGACMQGLFYFAGLATTYIVYRKLAVERNK